MIIKQLKLKVIKIYFFFKIRALTRLLYAKQNQKGSTEVGVQLQRVKAAISATATRFSGFMQHVSMG